MEFDPIHKLNAQDSVDSFNCNQPALNQFLQLNALVNQKTGSSQTYVCCKDGEVAGFYSLTVGSVERGNAPGRVIKGLPRYPVPVMILARLAVDKKYHGKGLGRALLKDAVLRTLNVADIAGIRALIVHAKDDAARRWYAKWGFEPSPTDPYHLFLLLQDMKAITGEK